MVKRLLGGLLSCWTMVAWAADAPIPYEVTQPSGYSTGSVGGADAYAHKRRGDLDKERMFEVAPIDKPLDLPPPTVVAPTPLPIVQEFKAGKVLTKSDLRGEDAVFQRISDDAEKEKCLFDPAACGQLPAAQQNRQFIPVNAK